MSAAPERGAFRSISDAPVADPHVYSICYFGSGWVVPEVMLIDADSDDEAVDYARSSRPSTMREIWERHRLVAVIPAG